MRPEKVWQQLLPPESPEGVLDAATFAAVLPDGRRVLLPIRALPEAPQRGVASLILNQASFAVLDAIAGALLPGAQELAPEVVVAVPTLGLTLGEALARRLGHSRLVPLSTSRKFWYDEVLSQPIRSITTRQQRRVYLDPRMLPLLAGRRVLLVDDVLSTGASITAVLRLLRTAGVAPAGIAAAMLQGEGWRARLAQEAPALPVLAALATPLLARAGDEPWRPAAAEG